MVKKYWFSPKKYGWGFVPETLEGWAAILGLLILLTIALHTNKLLLGVPTADRILSFLFDAFILSAVFTFILKDKVKGGLKWRSGSKRRKRR